MTLEELARWLMVRNRNYAVTKDFWEWWLQQEALDWQATVHLPDN